MAPDGPPDAGRAVARPPAARPTVPPTGDLEPPRPTPAGPAADAAGRPGAAEAARSRRARPPRRPRPTPGRGSLFAVVGFLVGQIVALRASWSWPAAWPATGPPDGDREAGGAAGVVRRVSAWSGCGSGSSLGPWLASRVRGHRAICVADLGLRFRPIDLLGHRHRRRRPVRSSTSSTPRSSPHSTNFGAPTTKLTGGAHGVGLRGHRRPHRGRGALLRGAVLPGPALPGPGPGVLPRRLGPVGGAGPLAGGRRRSSSTGSCSAWPTASSSSSPAWPSSACVLAVIALPDRPARA